MILIYYRRAGGTWCSAATILKFGNDNNNFEGSLISYSPLGNGIVVLWQVSLQYSFNIFGLICRVKILIVEDQLELADNIQTYLGQEGYVCEAAVTYSAAEDKLSAFDYDCVVLDIMLPDGNGLKLLEMLKRQKSHSSVLIISAKNSLDDKISGLDLGADDYLTKPFHLPELNARLRAIYRRKSLSGDDRVKFNEIEIDTSANQVLVHDTPVELTKKEFDLLLYFITNKNRVLTRQAIAEHLWGDYIDNMANFDFVYQHVKNLRKKISHAQGKDYISTEYGLGYRFNTNLL